MKPLPSSFARRPKACLLARSSRYSGAPAWFRAAARDYVSDYSLQLAAFALGIRYFVVTRGRRACPLAPPQHGGAAIRVRLLAPLAADRAWQPPTSSSLGTEKRVRSLLLSTAARDPVSDCSLRSLRIALSSRLLRRHSGTKSVSARSSSARRRAIRCLIARSARCRSRLAGRLLRRHSGTKSVLPSLSHHAARVRV